MAINLSGLSGATTAATALGNLILVSPQKTIGYQPQLQGVEAAQQPPPILFHYEGEQSVQIESDITDHYVEDNTAIEDQWALRPEIITTDGYIGELNNVPPKALELLKKLAEKLTVVSAYTPVLSETAIIAYNNALLLYQVAKNAIDAGVAAWSSINGDDGQNVIGETGLEGGVFDPRTGQIRNNQSKQQIAFQQFYGYWRSRTLFTVQTPWAIFENMAIQKLHAIQDADTKVITDFKVTFKMMRFAKTNEQIVTSVGPVLAGRAAAQNAALVDLGTSTPSPSIGLAAGLGNMGVV